RGEAGPEVDRDLPRRTVERRQGRAVEAQLHLRDRAVDVELHGLDSGSKTEEEREEGDRSARGKSPRPLLALARALARPRRTASRLADGGGPGGGRAGGPPGRRPFSHSPPRT